MINQIKMYALGAIAIIVSIFGAAFAYRGKKIDALKKDVETERDNVKDIERVIETKKKVEAIQERYNEINANIAKSSSDDKRSRLSKFNRD